MKKICTILATVMLIGILAACGASTCHNCGKPLGNDPVEAGGRSYCSYDCYMTEALGF